MAEQPAAEATLVLQSTDGAYYAIPWAMLEQHRLPEEQWDRVRATVAGELGDDDTAGLSFGVSPLAYGSTVRDSHDRYALVPSVVGWSLSRPQP